METSDKVRVRSFIKKERRAMPRMPRLLRIIGIRNFIWIFAVCAVAYILQFYGTPHLRFDYRSYPSNGAMIDCGYVGLHPQRVIPASGYCPLIALLKESK